MLSCIPEFSPPKIPAKHNGFSLSQIIKSSSLSSRSIPSRVLNLVPLESVLTKIFPLIFSRKMYTIDYDSKVGKVSLFLKQLTLRKKSNFRNSILKLCSNSLLELKLNYFPYLPR